MKDTIATEVTIAEERMKTERIAFVQPFGVQDSGGGPRILRRLLEAAPVPVISLSVSPWTPSPTALVEEVHLPIRPHLRRLETTRFAVQADRFRTLYGARFRKRLAQFCRERGVTAIHSIAHDLDFWFAFQAARDLEIPFYLTVHDELSYNMQGSPALAWTQERLADVWRQADGRTVISEEMGREYDRRHGEHPYIVTTDGLENTDVAPRPRSDERLHVYFMGALHLSYEQNFRALVQALEAEQKNRPDGAVSLTLRGGLPFDLPTTTLPLDVRGWGTQEDIERDLEEADLLYLPLPFNPDYADFARYSLSTKMVTYLGAGLPILYHGPTPAAAGDLLGEYDAAVLAHSLDPAALRSALHHLGSRREALVAGAARLARARFDLHDIRQAFWSTLLSHRPDASAAPLMVPTHAAE